MNLSCDDVAEVPETVVTVMSTVPPTLENAGLVAVIDVSLLTVNVVAAVLPNFTAVAPIKYVPVMVTGVPPGAGPDDGEIPVIVGVASKTVKMLLPVPAWLSSLVTITSQLLLGCAPLRSKVQVICVGDTTFTLVAVMGP